MHIGRQDLRAALLFALASSASACGGSVGADSSDAGVADANAPVEAAAPGCLGDAPLCCPQSCAAGQLTHADCAASAWICPADSVLLAPGEACDSDCEAPVDASADAGTPVCPSVYSVYGDTDPSDNLGHVDPRLYASGTCGGPTEQLSDIDAGPSLSDAEPDIAATDLKISLQQSAPGSGMFVTVIHQTTPFPFDLTTCLMSAGHGTGSSPIGTEPGTMALVNDPEDEIFPQVQLDTNLAGDDLIFDVALSVDSSFTLNTVSCAFTKN
jgi:hypothetical protein